MESITEETQTDDIKAILHHEDLIIVWLDITIDNNNIICSKRASLLRNCINDIRTFTDKNQCLEYMTTICDERIFLITSGTLGEIFVPEIHNLTQISEIYIFCCDIIKHNQWTKLYPKIRGIFSDENSLMSCLEKNAKRYRHSLISITINPTNERSLQDIDEDQVAFIWSQLMMEILYRLPKTSVSKKQMVDECRQHYADNPVQLNMIDEFYNKYNENLAIEWYTKDSFLYRLLNKAFRTQNIDIIFNYHYFLTDLIRSLTSLYLNQFSGKTELLTVYRGQHMHIDEVERLRNSIGQLMSVNTFFSTTTSCIVATDFAGNGEDRWQGEESVVFQIEIDLSIQRRPFGKIDQFSNTKDENEILFSMGSIFRIENVELFTDDIWLVTLVLTDEVKKEVDSLLEYFTKHIGNQPSLLELGVLLSKIGDFERAKRFYLCLLNELPENHHDLGVLYNNLGEIYRKEGYFDIAMKYYKLATEELIESFDIFDPWFAIVHSNIATIYNVRQQFDQALIHYRCALHIIERNNECSDGELFSTIYNGMATIFQQKGQFQNALNLYKKALKIEHDILPIIHPSLGITYNNIGQLYLQLNDNSKALENFLQALSIMLATLPNNHQDLVFLYASIGAVSISQNEISSGLEHLLKAEKMLTPSILTSNQNSCEDLYKLLITALCDNKMVDLAIYMNKKLLDIFQTQIQSGQYKTALWIRNFGRLLFHQDHFQETFVYQKMALDIIQQLPPTEKNKNLYILIIDDLFHARYFDIAIEHYTRLLNEERDIQSLFVGKLHNNLGVIYDHMENDSMALKHYTTALNCYNTQSDKAKNEIAIIHYNIAVILHNLSDYEGACLNLWKSLDTINHNDYKFHAKCHQLLGNTYEKTNNWLCAREHFHKAVELARRANSHPQFIEQCTRSLQPMILKLEENASTTTNCESLENANKD